MEDDALEPTADEAAELPAGFFHEPASARKHYVEGLTNRRERPVTGTEAWRTMFENGDPAVIPALVAVVNLDPDPVVRRRALFGLSRMSDRAAIEGLLPGLRASDRASRAHAIKGLGRLRAREALPDLVAQLDDWYGCVMAAEALVAIRDERALEPLRRAAEKGSPWRRRRLRGRAEELEGVLGPGVRAGDI